MFIRQFLQRIPSFRNFQLLNAQEGVFMTKAIKFMGKKSVSIPPSSPEIKLNKFPATQPPPKDQHILQPPPSIGPEVEYLRDERDQRDPAENPEAIKNVGSVAGLVEFLSHPSIWSLNNNYFNILMGVLLLNYLFWISGAPPTKPHDVSHDMKDGSDSPKTVENVMDHSMD